MGETREADVGLEIITETPIETPGPEKDHLTKFQRAYALVKKYGSFVGPGLMVSVAYMDPGNYSTDVTAGAAKQYTLLFTILLSTVIALYLQTLAIKLGSVTGKDLACNCREHLPRWVGYILYVFAEATMIATDIAEVIGTAIALNILLHIPLIAGTVLTIVDVILILFAYRPGKGMKAVRLLEYFVSLLLLAVMICFAVLLAKIPQPAPGPVFKGYLPTHGLITDGGVYMAAGILGATVMPHSLYLGSAIAVPRVRAFDMQHGLEVDTTKIDIVNYEPSMAAIKHAYRYSVAELTVSLCTAAIFVNSAILIVAGATLYGTEAANDADLYSIYDMLKKYLGKGIAVTFMVALLCSGQSAGVICTIAGQIVSEGHLKWRCRPWIRRIATRLLAIVPCVVVAAAVGRKGLSEALNWSQVVLTITLPFLSLPLVYLTSNKKVMTVYTASYEDSVSRVISHSARETRDEKTVSSGNERLAPVECYANHWTTTLFGALICVFIFIVNVYLLVEVGLNGTP